MLVLVTTSFLTAWTGGNAMAWHGRSGVAIIGLLSFRIVWGFIGSTHARFARFVRGPATVLAYLRGNWQGIGHNPLGALSVLALLAILGCQALGGLFANDDIAFNGPYSAAISKHLSDWITGWHKRGSWLVFALVALHVGAILFYIKARGEKLIAPMLTGSKEVPATLAGESARGGGPLAFVVALSLGLAAAWAASGALLPAQPAASAAKPAATVDW
ncbi:MAG: cytochrome b/b6 domain-containing protein [Proteobacteria bacterium]|nr:cytochrome b/b6 domain-containing protein [Pseudomonadota bacterium]